MGKIGEGGGGDYPLNLHAKLVILIFKKNLPYTFFPVTNNQAISKIEYFENNDFTII